MKFLVVPFLSVVLSVTLQAQSDSSTVVSMLDMDLESLMNIKVSTASKNSEGIQDAPAIISVVTAQEIQSYGALSLVDVLNRTTNLYMTGSYYFPNNLAGIRGDVQTHTTSHVLILIDGRPCRESFYGGLDLAVFNTFPVSSIERIEIIRGPGSVLYGTNAVSGVINIITQKKEYVEEGKISAAIGSFGTQSIQYTQSGSIGEVRVNSAASYFNQQGWNYTAVDQDSTIKTIDYGQQNLAMNFSARYKSINMKVFYGNSFRDVFGERPRWNANGSVNTLNTHRGFADVGVQHSFSDKWTASINATYNYFDQISIRDSRPVKFYSNDGLAEMTHNIELNEKIHLVAGGLVNLVTGEGRGIDPVTNIPVKLVEAYSDIRWATYVQADYKPIKILKLIAGAQYNKTPGTTGNLAPRGGLILHLSPNLGIKGLYGQSFKSPAQAERFTLIPNINYGNPDLKPELISTTDAQIFYNTKKFQASAGYYYSHQTNSIVRVPYLTNAAIYTNQGSLTMQGVETEMKVNVTSFLSATSNFSYQTNENNLKQKDVTAISNYMAKGGINVRNSWIDAGIFYAWFSKPADVINTQSGMDSSKQRVLVNPVPQAFGLLSLNINLNVSALCKWEEKPAFLLSIYGENLLDEIIYNPEFSRRNINSLPARGGRAIFGGITIKF